MAESLSIVSFLENKQNMSFCDSPLIPPSGQPTPHTGGECFAPSCNLQSGVTVHTPMPELTMILVHLVMFHDCHFDVCELDFQDPPAAISLPVYCWLHNRPPTFQSELKASIQTRKRFNQNLKSSNQILRELQSELENALMKT